MELDKSLIYETKKLLLVRYPRFGSEVAKANIEYRTDLKYHTAAADGKNVYIDPNYLEKLNEDERVFLMAHEFMHNKFLHMYRLKDSNGVMRDFDLWNAATDAIINANLARDGFTIREGWVNRPEAINYTAEEFYEILLKEREEKKQQEGGQKGAGQQGSGKQEGEQQENEQQESGQGEVGKQQGRFIDDHSIWKEVFQNRENSTTMNKKEDNTSRSTKDSSKTQEETKDESEFENDFDEKSEFEQNREEQLERAKKRLEKTKRKMLKEQDLEESIELGNIGESKSEIDWKVLLHREIEKNETIWSQRRSIAENNYAYRLEERDSAEDAETEVMIDISGSVDLKLVKAFLREVKSILGYSKLKVGCFNEKFWGLVDIKTPKDIDDFKIPKVARSSMYAWTEDWDLAVRSFSKKKETNKIVFTDGYPLPGTMPKDDLRKENVIWMVYGNRHFKPCCGKVINITEKQLGKLNQVNYERDER